jgi:hypothetical protein
MECTLNHGNTSGITAFTLVHRNVFILCEFRSRISGVVILKISFLKGKAPRENKAGELGMFQAL